MLLAAVLVFDAGVLDLYHTHLGYMRKDFILFLYFEKLFGSCHLFLLGRMASSALLCENRESVSDYDYQSRYPAFEGVGDFCSYTSATLPWNAVFPDYLRYSSWYFSIVLKSCCKVT